ncbi:hypothetical protein [Ekhidna sp.]
MKSFFQFVFYVLLVFFLLSSIISMFDDGVNQLPNCDDNYVVINDNNDRLHQREWDFASQSNSFCVSYNTIESTSLESGESRNEIEINREEYEEIWGHIYSELVTDSKRYIEFLADSLVGVSKTNNLSRDELAELIVSFVQDIPYSYVRSKPCVESDNKGKPCIGNIAFGLLSPYEFIHSLYGDCDTRTVLIYAILESLNYDPMIVVSNEYAHAMLALNIAASGDHLKHRGKNYYFWETTGKGWPIGMLPPNSNNVNYWKIALVNEL